MKNEVEYVNEDYATPYGKLASDNSTDYRLDRGEKEGVHFKEHVVGVDPREIDQVGYYRHNQRGNGREEKVDRLASALEGVVSRYKHNERTENNCAVVQECVDSCKGDAGVVAENVCGINEIYCASEEAQRAYVSASGVSDLAASPYYKGHGVHKYTAGIEGEVTAPLKAYLVSCGGFPDHSENINYR